MPILWRPTAAEAQQLAECSAIVYGHDGTWEVVRLDAFPKELAAYQRQCDRQEQAQVQRDALRKSAPHGVKVSKTVWRKVVGAQAKGPR